MITLHLYKAQRTSEPVSDVTIILNEELPEITGRSGEPVSEVLDRARRLYVQEATQLATLLLKTLPGGTLDQLMVALLEAKASHFAVPYGTEEKA